MARNLIYKSAALWQKNKKDGAEMKTIAMAALAAVTIGSVSMPAYACGGMSIKKVKSMVHSMVHDDETSGHEQMHGNMTGMEVLVAPETATQTSRDFVAENLHGAEAGETALAQFGHMPVYTTPVKMPGGDSATLYVDATTGAVIGLFLDSAISALHSSMDSHMQHMGGSASGSSTGQSSEHSQPDSGDHSQHQH